MKNLFLKISHNLILISLAASLFLTGFWYESNYAPDQVIVEKSKVTVSSSATDSVVVLRDQENLVLKKAGLLMPGDIIESDSYSDIVVSFAKDGELRLDKNSKLEVVNIDYLTGDYVFRLEEGRLWLNTMFTGVNLNISVENSVIIPTQGVLLVEKVSEANYLVYSHQKNALIAFVDDSFKRTSFVDKNDEGILNSIFLPQGTKINVYSTKIGNNSETIAKLFFSKLVKEFDYGIFESSLMLSDTWLNWNVAQDISLKAVVRESRLKEIRSRGLKYSTLTASNYKTNKFIREFLNGLTFTQDRIAQRNMEAVNDLLLDSKYLFDYGRKEEAVERMKIFDDLARELISVNGDNLKVQYLKILQDEYQYLSFANPEDSLFELKEFLRGIYLDMFKNNPKEVELRFGYLMEDLETMAFYAERDQLVDLEKVFDQYIKSFKVLLDNYEEDLVGSIELIKEQNQILDSLFTKYPIMYRQQFITHKLYVENKYLGLLDSGNEKIEEIQRVIFQRIGFLRNLQEFFLNGKVPLIDAQNIVALLFAEIAKIELPSQYQVAVQQLFNQRLEDFAVFSRFLNSQEYVSSTFRGDTMRERYEQFKKDNIGEVSLEEMNAELLERSKLAENDYDLGKIIENDTSLSVVDENLINITTDENTTIRKVKTDESIPATDSSSPKVKR